MSTTASSPKKTPSTTITSSERRPPATNRSPSRMAAQTTSSSGAPTTVNRTRSARTGTPVSARAAAAAARPPAGSISDAGEETTPDDAKMMDFQTKLSALQSQLQETSLAYAESTKHASVLQIKLDETLKEQGMMEDTVLAHVERIEELEMEKRESVRARRELEQMYEAERVEVLREKEEGEREREGLVESLARLKEGFAQRELRERMVVGEDERRPGSLSRTSSLRSSDPSPNPDSRGERGGFAPQSSLQRSDSRSSSRLVLQKDKVIEGLRLELAEAQIKLVEMENKGGNSLHRLEKDMYDIKMQNARLMEENESFQLLLSEKTLNGDLAQSDLLRPPSHTGSPPRPSSAVPRLQRTSLADELEGHESSLDSEAGEGMDRKLQSEVNSLKDQNKALTLYINNIISRLLQHEQFEAILDKTPDLMAGPGAVSRKYAGHHAVGSSSEKELLPAAAVAPQEQQQGLLQRAGSVLRRKPRPMSQFQPQGPQTVGFDQPRIEEPTVHENPDTAPSIPLGQAPHRRSRSDWGAAAVVGSMYKGPAPSVQGAISPGLTSTPPNRTSFFTGPQQAPLGADGRARSGNSTPTVSEIERNKENQNQAHRDSKIPSSSSVGASPERGVSTRNSIQISNPDERPIFEPSNPSSNPSSPPQSTTSSGDRDGRGPSGAIMMGSKPRPLRLVQEADEEKAKRANRGQSWFGWMNKGGAAPPGSGFGGFLQGKGGEGGQ